MSEKLELEDPQDLRAEIGKCPVSTNERKNMSTKTLRKRIALVAVASLGFGLLSVTAANAAAIIANDVDITSTAATAVCSVDTAKEVAYAPVNSLGLTVLAASASDTETGFLTISGPAYWSADVDGTGGGVTLNSLTEAEITDAGSATNTGATMKFSGTGTVYVTVSETSGGAAIDTLTIYVTADCGSGTTYSALYSDVSTTDTASDSSWTVNVDEATSATAGGSLYIRVDGDNGYDANLTTGTYSASATNGALVNWGSAIGTAPLKGTLSAGSYADADGAVILRVNPASSAVGGSTVVTITHNGTPVATKSLTFYGQASSIEVGVVRIGATNGTIAAETATGFFTYTYKDGAGNTVPGDAATFVATTASTTIPTAASVKAPTASAAAVTDSGTGLVDAIETAIGSTTSGVFAVTCGSVSGKASITITHTNAISEAVLTKSVEVGCAGGIDTYAVSTDKASYKIGEIATITITAKDSKGNAVADSTVMTTDTVSVGGGLLTKAVAATDSFTGGVRTYKAQMTTAGTFNAVVSLAGSTTTSATTSYSVSGGDVAMSEVLKAIVSLIASINKQIAALQKALLRR